MDAEQKYLFDLQGYLLLKDVVPPAFVEACNRALDRYETMNPSASVAPVFGTGSYVG